MHEFLTLYRKYRRGLRYKDDSPEYAQGLETKEKAKQLLSNDFIFQFIIFEQLKKWKNNSKD
ncbi:MAG: hypothetical protein OXC92_02705 [Flavobacteriaceae bacterium]|nr:hypothetical protein [Flavobacteriaceae bacterium]MCY4299175.1 hypothetical protein [Flavobacteriaceae bacterium]